MTYQYLGGAAMEYDRFFSIFMSIKFKSAGSFLKREMLGKSKRGKYAKASLVFNGKLIRKNSSN
jgi:hypothetical protein